MSTRLRFVTRAAAVVVALLAIATVHRYWMRELSRLTGSADWIWVTDELEHVRPEAGLFVGSLHLDAPPNSALLKICGDREYVVYVNRTPAACGWSRPGFRLDLYDVGHLLRQGDNLIAVEVRSATPAGGLLCALDVDNVGRNVLTSGRECRLRPTFSLEPALLIGDRPVPVVWGVPPRFPWGYPQPVAHPRTLDEVTIEEPLRVDGSTAQRMPGGGWQLAFPRPTFGYLWLEFDGDELGHMATTRDEVVDLWRLRAEAQPIVRVAGQERWLDPEPRVISRVLVFAQRPPRVAELWPVPEEFRPGAPGVVQGKFGPLPRTRWQTRTPPE